MTAFRYTSIKEPAAGQAAGEPPKERPAPDTGGNGGGGNRSDLHPLIQGLLLTLPLPNTTWPAQDRLNWLVMANSIFKMIYPTGDAGDVEITLKK